MDVYDILVDAIISRLHLTTNVRFAKSSCERGYIITPNELIRHDKTHIWDSKYPIVIMFKEDKVILILIESYYYDIGALKQYNKYAELIADLADPSTEPLYLIYDAVEHITRWYEEMFDYNIRVAYMG